MTFDGQSFDPTLDEKRLTTQLERVKALLLDGNWRTLHEIQASVGGSEAGISARCRDLRKERFGGFVVQRRRRGRAEEGLWEYSLQIPQTEDSGQMKWAI